MKDPGDPAHRVRAMIDRSRILKYAQAVAREFHPERIILFSPYVEASWERWERGSPKSRRMTGALALQRIGS